MKKSPIIPFLSLVVTSIIFGLSYTETLPEPDNYLLGSLIVTIATCFAYWANPCTVECPGEDHGKNWTPSKPLSSMVKASPLPEKVDAVVVYRQHPKLQFLHLDPAHWCINVPHGEQSVEGALNDVSKVIGVPKDDLKVHPNLFEKIKIDAPKLTLNFHAVELPKWRELKLDPEQFKWLSLEESLKKTAKESEDLMEVLRKFADKLKNMKPLWAKTKAEAEDAKKKNVLWYQDPDKNHLMWGIVEKRHHHLNVNERNLDEIELQSEMGLLGRFLGLFKKDKNDHCMCPNINKPGEGISNTSIYVASALTGALAIGGAAVLGIYFLKPELLGV